MMKIMSKHKVTSIRPEDETKQTAEAPATVVELSDAATSEPTPAEATNPVDETAAKIEKLEAELRDARERAIRQQAEFENIRKRMQREQEEYRDYAVMESIRLFLPLLDGISGALGNKQTTLEDFVKGVELLDKQFVGALAKLGVEPIAALGAKFDPNMHQAIQMIDSTDVPEDHVAVELLRGFKIKDRILRPSMVMVARKPEAAN